MDAAVLERLNWYRLPPKIQEIKRRCGADVAVALLEHCGNRRVYVPMRRNLPVVDHENPLIALERGLVERLARQYPANYIHVPCAFHALLALRNEEIARQHRAGRDVEDIAGDFGVTPRWIWHIVATTPATDEEQLAARNTAILADHAAALSVAALAQKYNLSATQIRRILSQDHASARGADPRQISLF